MSINFNLISATPAGKIHAGRKPMKVSGPVTGQGNKKTTIPEEVKHVVQ